jgi:hypothetical protein
MYTHTLFRYFLKKNKQKKTLISLFLCSDFLLFLLSLLFFSFFLPIVYLLPVTFSSSRLLPIASSPPLLIFFNFNPHVSHFTFRLSIMNTLSHQSHSLARTNTVSRHKKSKPSLSHPLDKAFRQFSNSFAIAVVEQWDDEFDFLPSDTVLKIPDEINASTLKVNKDLNLIRQFSDFSKGKQK